MSEKIYFSIQKIQKTQFSFLSTYQFQLMNEALNHCFELICKQTESYFHRFIKSVSYQ